ncbi:MAG TPA: hypothetical protein VG294_05080 [Solirubrobacteraceae bacterium]|nr:hypothetical protein [Solirubrobacteraceae bacterium]
MVPVYPQVEEKITPKRRTMRARSSLKPRRRGTGSRTATSVFDRDLAAGRGTDD